MSTVSPVVNWTVTNNNILMATPLNGVSAIVTLTDKGPIAQPDEIITSVRRFRELYGKETVPDDSVSNVESALLNGSKLRISRVKAENTGDWATAIEAFRNYDEPYQMVLSHLDQWFLWNEETSAPSADYTTVVNQALSLMKDKKDCSLFIGLPKYTSIKSKTFPEYFDMIAMKTALNEAVGSSEYISYFAQGIYLPDPDSGTATYSDGMGAILGLADTVASTKGPWYHFSGANRGVLNASKLGYNNYGLKGNYEFANQLAKDRIMIFVEKPTRTSSTPVRMLWHNFTDISINNSQRFLGVQRLIYYIKKNLGPILESYLEEPNTFSTWNKIFLDGKRVMDYLLTNNAITEYTWAGDQTAQTYQDLQINNEADVRSGIYKIKLSIKEVVAMQQIDIELIIDASAGTVTI